MVLKQKIEAKTWWRIIQDSLRGSSCPFKKKKQWSSGSTDWIEGIVPLIRIYVCQIPTPNQWPLEVCQHSQDGRRREGFSELTAEFIKTLMLICVSPTPMVCSIGIGSGVGCQPYKAQRSSLSDFDLPPFPLPQCPALNPHGELLKSLGVFWPHGICKWSLH